MNQFRYEVETAQLHKPVSMAMPEHVVALISNENGSSVDPEAQTDYLSDTAIGLLLAFGAVAAVGVVLAKDWAKNTHGRSETK